MMKIFKIPNNPLKTISMLRILEISLILLSVSSYKIIILIFFFTSRRYIQDLLDKYVDQNIRHTYNLKLIIYTNLKEIKVDFMSNMG